ncbi:hypothetical protein Tco_1268232 [Tanacetum coccineum]
MAIPIDDDDGTGYTSKVICVEYEWTPPHCLECKLFGHNSEKCPKKVIVVEPTIDASANDGFTKVVSRKNKGKNDSSQTIGGIRLPKPKSNFYWEQKKINGSKSGLNAASTSGTAKGGDKHKVPSPPRVQSNLATPVSNPFDILTAGEEIACDPSGQNPKVSEPLGSGSSKADDDKIQEEDSLWSRFQISKKDSLSKSQDDLDDESEVEEYPPYDFIGISSTGGGFSLEDDDLVAMTDMKLKFIIYQENHRLFVIIMISV